MTWMFQESTELYSHVKQCVLKKAAFETKVVQSRKIIFILKNNKAKT